MTAAAAAAAAARGHKGTGYDEMVARSLGVSWPSAIGQANAVLAGKEEEIQAVAEMLEEKKTIVQFHVNESFRRAEDRKQGIFTVGVVIYKSGKKIGSFSTKSYHGEVVIPQLPEFSKN